MSEVLASSFKKPECGDMFNLTDKTLIRDVLGGLVNFMIVGTDPDIVGAIDGSSMTEDYTPDEGNVNPDGTFLITIETDAATYVVVLADGTQFTITPTQSTAYLGQWYPARVRSVRIGTTGSFSVGY